MVYGAKLAARRGGKGPFRPAPRPSRQLEQCRLLCREAGTRRAYDGARQGRRRAAHEVARERSRCGILSESGLRHRPPRPCTPFSPAQDLGRRARAPSAVGDRGGAQSEMRGGLSRRDVGIAVVVAGLGALTLAATTVVGA